jgi:hypothetical protein
VNKPPLVTPYVSIELKDDIIHFNYLPGTVITLEVAKEIVKQRLTYMDGTHYPILITGEGIRAMDKQSRDYFSKEGTEGVLAGAILVNSVYTEFFGNFFLRITQPEIPAKLFTDEKKALDWLKQFKPKV